MSKRNSPIVGRRNFLKGATLVGAAAVTPRAARAQPPAVPLARAVPRPNLVVETMPPTRDPVTQTTGGGDFMVDVLKTLDLDYCAISPASMFRGVQEATTRDEASQPRGARPLHQGQLPGLPALR